jgi:hypothetical protein
VLPRGKRLMTGVGDPQRIAEGICLRRWVWPHSCQERWARSQVKRETEARSLKK